MPNRTSTQAGDWASSSTWTGGNIPSSTDRVTLAHAVTISTPQTIADDGGSDAITINAGGQLIIQSTLTCNGSIQSQASNRLQVDIQAGGGIEFGNSGHTIKTPSQYSGGTPWFRVRGTSVSRCFIRTASGGTNARFTGSVNYYGLIDAEYCDFLRIGSTGSTYAMAVSANSDGSDGNASLFRLVNCTFDACGGVEFATDVGAYAKVTIQNCTFLNGVGTYDLYTRAYSDRLSLGVRLIDGNTFEGATFWNAPRDWTITNNVFDGFFQTSNPDDTGWALLDNNLFILTDAGQTNFAGTEVNNNYFYFNQPAKTNAHYVGIGAYNGVTPLNIVGNIFEGNMSNGDGDCMLVEASISAAVTVNVEENIVLPNAAGECSGTLLSALGGSNHTLNINKNTYIMGTAGGVAVGETYAGHAGMLASFKNNLAWDTSVRGYKLFDSGANNSVSDLVTSGNANYNGGFNFTAGSNAKGYHNLEFSSGSPGANDVEADPEFFDDTRDFLAFDVSLGGDGVIANAVDRFLNKTTGYTPQALVTWVKAGFAPTNSAYEGTGEAGVDIGAVPYQAPAAGGGASKNAMMMGM